MTPPADVAVKMDPFGPRLIDRLLDAIAHYERAHGHKPSLIRLSPKVYQELHADAAALAVLQRNDYAGFDTIGGVRIEHE